MPQTMTPPTLAPELLHRMDAYWRAANYLSVGSYKEEGTITTGRIAEPSSRPTS